MLSRGEKTENTQSKEKVAGEESKLAKKAKAGTSAQQYIANK